MAFWFVNKQNGVCFRGKYVGGEYHGVPLTIGHLGNTIGSTRILMAGKNLFSSSVFYSDCKS